MTREIWTGHMAVIVPTALELVSEVGKLALELTRSPLGQRARRNPEISFALAALSLGFLAKLVRFN